MSFSRYISIPRDTAADSLSRDRLSENADHIPGSKFDTTGIHTTKSLEYHIGRSYFSRYRTFRARFTSFTVAEIGGIDLGGAG